MPESTMICLDNSDWMRNGDYVPSRMEAQKDAAGYICNDKTGTNPENTVGILTMAGTGVDLRVSPTEESGKILASFANMDIGGITDLQTGVRIAALALKHRKNKTGTQRIIVFIGGPIYETKEVLVKLGKELKKNTVAIDIVSVGEIDDNQEKLTDLINAANKDDNSHLIVVPSGVSPVNAIISSPLVSGGSAGVGGAGDMGTSNPSADPNFDVYGGIDPEMDPELAHAIRVSTEEARAQEEARVKAQQEASGESSSSMDSSGAGADVTSALAAADTSGTNLSEPVPFGGYAPAYEEDEEVLMQRALEMSMRDMEMSPAPEAASAGNPVRETAMDMDEEEALKQALALSTGAAPLPPPSSSFTTIAPPAVSVAGAGVVDSAFVSQLLGSVDQSDPLVAAALAQLGTQSEETTESETKEKDRNGGDGSGGDGSNKRKGDDV